MGSRSFEHPINGTTRRRLSGLVDIAASSNALTCSQGSKCDFVREVQRGDRLWVGNQEFTVYDSQLFAFEDAEVNYFHPGKITLGKKEDSRSGAPLYSTAVSGVAVYTTYESVVEIHHSSAWRVHTMTLTGEGRVTGSELGFGNRRFPHAVCPYKSRNIICRDDSNAEGIKLPATSVYPEGMVDWETAGNGSATPVRPTSDDVKRLGYGGSHGGVGGHMFMTRETNGQPKILGGDVPELESYGGEVGRMGYGVYNYPRTMGSPGSAGYSNMKFGGTGGAAFELDAQDFHMDGEIDMNGGRGADDRNSGTYSAAGGGAGGSILIVAKGTFSGTGSLSAKGGDGGRASLKGGGGGGGGGRIAIHFGTRTNSKLINMTVRGGNSALTVCCSGKPARQQWVQRAVQVQYISEI